MLHDDVAGDLEKNVWNEEDLLAVKRCVSWGFVMVNLHTWAFCFFGLCVAYHKDDVISIPYVQSQVLVHSLNLGVPDVRTVEDAGEVDEEEYGADHKVQLPHQSLLCLCDELPPACAAYAAPMRSLSPACCRRRVGREWTDGKDDPHLVGCEKTFNG
ncbi:hypothetical protein PG989_014197 [Apiospora arundinis]